MPTILGVWLGVRCRYWGSDLTVIDDTLSLLFDLTSFGDHGVLLSLDIVNFLLTNHSVRANLPYGRQRTLLVNRGSRVCRCVGAGMELAERMCLSDCVRGCHEIAERLLSIRERPGSWPIPRMVLQVPGPAGFSSRLVRAAGGEFATGVHCRAETEVKLCCHFPLLLTIWQAFAAPLVAKLDQLRAQLTAPAPSTAVIAAQHTAGCAVAR